jgi:hypothetical protein
VLAVGPFGIPKGPAAACLADPASPSAVAFQQGRASAADVAAVQVFALERRRQGAVAERQAVSICSGLLAGVGFGGREVRFQC